MADKGAPNNTDPKTVEGLRGAHAAQQEYMKGRIGLISDEANRSVDLMMNRENLFANFITEMLKPTAAMGPKFIEGKLKQNAQQQAKEAALSKVMPKGVANTQQTPDHTQGRPQKGSPDYVQLLRSKRRQVEDLKRRLTGDTTSALARISTPSGETWAEAHDKSVLEKAGFSEKEANMILKEAEEGRAHRKEGRDIEAHGWDREAAGRARSKEGRDIEKHGWDREAAERAKAAEERAKDSHKWTREEKRQATQKFKRWMKNNPADPLGSYMDKRLKEFKKPGDVLIAMLAEGLRIRSEKGREPTPQDMDRFLATGKFESRSFAKAPKPKKKSMKNVRFKDGTIRVVDVNNPQEMVGAERIVSTAAGKTIKLHDKEGNLLFEMTPTQYGAQAGKDLAVERDVNDVLADSNRMIASATDAKLGVAGGVARFLDSTIKQGGALIAQAAKIAGAIPKAKADEWQASLSNTALSKWAGESAALRSDMVRFAYTMITTLQGSRPSNEDIENAMRMIGRAGSAQQLRSALKSIQAVSIRKWETAMRSRDPNFDVRDWLQKNGHVISGINKKDEEMEWEIPSAEEISDLKLALKNGYHMTTNGTRLTWQEVVEGWNGRFKNAPASLWN